MTFEASPLAFATLLSALSPSSATLSLDFGDIVEELEAGPRPADQRVELLAGERDHVDRVLLDPFEDALAKPDLVIGEDRDRGAQHQSHQRVGAEPERTTSDDVPRLARTVLIIFAEHQRR